MNVSKSRLPFWLLLVICLVAIVVLTPIAITKRSKSAKAYICSKCGIRLWIAGDELAGSATPGQTQRKFEQTELSRWFALHISTNCDHTWSFNHSSGQVFLSLGRHRLWEISGASGSSPTPPLLWLASDDRAQLESLLRENPEACRMFIHEGLQLKPEKNH